MRLVNFRLATVLLGLAACTVDPPPAAPGDQSPARPAPEQSPEPTAPAPEVAPGAADRVDIRELAQRLRQVGAVMNAMKEKAREAAAAERSDCEKSFAGITAAIEASQQATAALGLPVPRWTIAPRPEYLRLCRTLPPPVQRCSRYDYRVDHAEECTPLMDGLPGEQAAVIERLYHRDEP